MSTLSELERRKHDLRVEMVRLRAENNLSGGRYVTYAGRAA